MNALQDLAKLLVEGRSVGGGKIRPAAEAVMAERFHRSVAKDIQIRDAYALADAGEGGVPWAGLINPDNPNSGPYGGTSLVWFPGETSTLIGLGVGTRGIAPDEGILTRPGHRRRTAALRRMLAEDKVPVWAKADPAALGISVPRSFSDRLPEFAATFKRYANEMYCVAELPRGPEHAERTLRAFLSLYAYERGWKFLSSYGARQGSCRLGHAG